MACFSRRQPVYAALLLALGAVNRPAQAYVDLAPTMAKLITDSRSVSLVEVVQFDRAARILVLKEIQTYKGPKAGGGDGGAGTGEIRQMVAASETAIIPRPIMQWAQPGAQAVLFSSGGTALVCIGQAWYQEKLVDGAWKLGVDRPELPLSYYGSVSRLAGGIGKMIAGGDAVLTMIPHGVGQGASFDLALNTAALPGLVQVQRLRANMSMPPAVFSVSNSASYMLGMGPVDEKDLPEVIARLRSPEAAIRAEAADDLRQLAEIIGAAKTRPALPALASLLDDSAPRVRLLAAAATLRITHANDKALGVILAGLHSGDAAVRRNSAQAAAVTGQAGAPLVQPLGALLKDPDEGVLVAALQALATLGPVAAGARDAMVPLLDQPQYMIDAADALGRMGPRAQPIPPQMARMLQSDQAQVRWAAVRGMSQIGGPESIPAAEFIAREIGTASETDAYNMVMYLALIGPPARAAAATIKNVPIINPVLPRATNWAMHCDAALPWENDALAGFGDVGNFIFASYVTALGERLRPAALKLAPLLIAGRAGANVPEWGYRILNAAPAESVATIAPHLADPDKKLRERAAVILGYMGPAAASAKDPLQKCLLAAGDEKEKNLLAWALGEVTRD